MSRYKGASENAEKIEDELKVEKRKLQREVRAPPSVWELISLLCVFWFLGHVFCLHCFLCEH